MPKTPPPWSWFPAFALALAAIVLLVGLQPGELVKLQAAEGQLAGQQFFLAFVAASLIVAVVALKAFLATGRERVLWVGVAVSLMGLYYLLNTFAEGLNLKHYYLVLFAYGSLVFFLIASRVRGVAPPAVRKAAAAGAVGVALGLVLAALLLASLAPSVLPIFIDATKTHTSLFRVLMGVAAVLFLLAARYFYFSLYLREPSPVTLGLAATSIFFAAGTASYALAITHPDEWHWIAPALMLAGFLVLLGGFLAVYLRERG
jgi:hypothetical protein